MPIVEVWTVKKKELTAAALEIVKHNAHSITVANDNIRCDNALETKSALAYGYDFYKWSKTKIYRLSNAFLARMKRTGTLRFSGISKTCKEGSNKEN